MVKSILFPAHMILIFLESHTLAKDLEPGMSINHWTFNLPLKKKGL